MQTTRRGLFQLAGGVAAGAVLTPVPWRLITDAALWSENWPGIPQPLRGEIRTRFTNCALCPAGCAVRARCVGNQPVFLAGAGGHALCAVGVLGHQLPYHADRVRQGPVQEASTAIQHRASQGTVAVLDLRPGRTASWTYRRAMSAVPRGFYLAPQRRPEAVDLRPVKTVLSFGVPVLAGWGTPATVRAERAHFQLIQAEPVESQTGALADVWLPLRPGTETALALGVAHVLVRDHRRTPSAAYARIAGQFPPRRAAEICGIPEEQIVRIAGELFRNGPALVLSRNGAPAVLELNALLGSLGQTVVARRETPVPAEWKNAARTNAIASVPDGSIDALLIDEGPGTEYIPWPEIARKLVPRNPLVVVFSSSREGYARHAQYLLPTAIYPEVTEDIPAAVDSPAAMFRLSIPLVEPPAGVVDPAQFVARLAGLTEGDSLRQRADAIHHAGRGNLFAAHGEAPLPIRAIGREEFWKALESGASWIDAPSTSAVPESEPAPFAEGPAEKSDLPLMVVTTAVPQPLSPLMIKLYRESQLRSSAGHAALHPETARSQMLIDGRRALLTTARGEAEVQVTVNAGVPPGVVHVAAGPDLLDICGTGAGAKVVAL